MPSAKSQTRVHIVIPDTQTKAGVPTAHLGWIGQFIADEYDGTDLTVIHLGDHWDMPSLSSYDKGKRAMEGRRYVQDIDAGNAAFNLLHDGFAHVPARRVFLLGNHEDRITRAAESDAQLDGVVSLEHLDTEYWETHAFREPVSIDGIVYAHYFYNPMTGRPYSGANLELRLKQVGHSFTMGHQQGRKWAQYDTIQGSHLGLVVGSCYVHDEDYLGPQTVNYWRGIVVCHQVERGQYDPMFVSLDYLARRYEGKRLSAIKWRH
jgi:hypothetical protein